MQFLVCLVQEEMLWKMLEMSMRARASDIQVLNLSPSILAFIPY